MDINIKKSFVAGVERLAAWVDLLDEINVFPVADGDTGRNLLISLTPLREIISNNNGLSKKLMMSARGNSGNIASRFFLKFIEAETFEDLTKCISRGSKEAWSAVNEPKPGTMLTLLNDFEDYLKKNGLQKNNVPQIIDYLEESVKSTVGLLPKLREAGVVDSGALGLFIFFEGFLYNLVHRIDECKSLYERFGGYLAVKSSFNDETEKGYCVDTVIKMEGDQEDAVKKISQLGESVVVVQEEGLLKVHLHTDDESRLKDDLNSIGSVVKWSSDDLEKQMVKFRKKSKKKTVHIISDAAGSLTRNDAHSLNFTLLESYINAGEMSMPESHFNHEEIYRLIRNGVKVSTSQASSYERFQNYNRITDENEHTIYMCVGSVFTGNYDAAVTWKRENDQRDRFHVIDTESASGRLGTAVLATAQYAEGTDDPYEVLNFAREAVQKTEEYIFLDKLQYLAAGGRLSKTSAFFGDLLNMKPVVSPMGEGAKKVGVVRNQDDQIKFALEKLSQSITGDSSAFIMIQYTDNKKWVDSKVRPEIERIYTNSKIILQPLSLTTGVHTGPGTWAIAFLQTK